ncbi:MAG TPA: AEC family transporter [Rectinemataceae bacterium]|nr:AEC family transporter [Rectinemataceae bacterium]
MSLPPSTMQIFILFLLMATGFVAGKLRILDEDTVKKLSRFLVVFVVPCLLIVSMQKPLTPELRERAFLVLGLSFATYALAFPLAFLLAKIMRLDRSRFGVHSFAAVFSNVAFMGFPVLMGLFGKDILFEASIAAMPFQILSFSIGAAMLASGSGHKAKLGFSSFVKPAGVASIVGLGLFLLNVALPLPLFKAMSLLGDTTTPLSMCVIGATLAETDLGGALGDWRIWVSSAWRLLGLPLVVWFVFRALGVGGTTLGLLVVMTAMPVAANTTMLSAAYGGDHKTASALIFVSTALSLVTIPLLAGGLFGI